MGGNSPTFDKRGRKKSPPAFPGEHASKKQLIHYRVKNALYITMIGQAMTNKELSAIADIPIGKIERWFTNTGNDPRNITLVDLFKIIEAIQTSLTMLPLGKHMRQFNYVELFEPKYGGFTRYELELLKENQELKEKLASLENKASTDNNS